ncbi:MAG: DUF819 family protein, partial [Saprospiraceae bacterium]|nr:DUF819 family protein [Saprospiraceae bacterium]
MSPYFTNDAIVTGILLVVLALIFYTAQHQSSFWKRFYRFVPALLLCYFIPALLNWPLGLISGDESSLYFVSSRYFLPACLVLLCLSIDLQGILNLGPKALIMFIAATLGIIIGGPIALYLVLSIAPGLIPANPDELWRGLSTVAGSWIGGGANQTAMKEIFQVSDQLFGTMVVVDVVVANIWMGFLLYGANVAPKVDRWLKSDTSAIVDLQRRVENYRASVEKNPTTTDLFIMLGVAFGGTALAHWGADVITPLMMKHEETLHAMRLESLTSSFFWIIVIATTIGFSLSFTRAKALEGVGASKWGSIFIYFLVATIG